ncbi:nuclear transport factor 2 family protein [Dyadobacter tibetensis]|uniref:nuclear transport factor 2 family protein n=1 Tax=Dyadobacter tibetensis TaxID=1211851 RepID=UPI0004729136|nr:nuclear transport factor 2 family protein [Dyadobacter tibetensis]
MKSLFIFCLLIGINAVAQAPFRTSDATNCTEGFFQAMLDENTDQLNNLLAPDFSIISMNGQVVDRETFIQAIAQGYVVIDSGQVSGLQTKDYQEVGVVHGSWRVKGSLENNTFSETVTFMTVCVRQGGTWRLSAVQLTPSR